MNPITWCIRIITISFIAQFYLSLNLWFPIDRTYPTVAMFPFLDVEYGHGGTRLISGLFIFCLVFASFVEKFKKQTLTAALILLGLLVLEDLNRFQAWSYLYAILLGIITWNCWKEDDKKAFVSLQFVMAMVYFWTGFQKFNIQFVTDVYPWIVKTFEMTKWLKDYEFLGYGIGLFETFVGCLLLFNKTLRLGVYLGIALHIGILAILIKSDWNTVVYPWNIAMIGLLLMLFYIPIKENTRFIFSTIRPYYFIIFLFGFVPFLDFFKLAPHCFALGMYSGTSLECDLIIHDEGRSMCVPQNVWKDLIYQSDDESLLSQDDWTGRDLNIPPYATEYSFKYVAKEFCSCAKNFGGYVELYQPIRFEDRDTTIRITCKELVESPM